MITCRAQDAGVAVGDRLTHSSPLEVLTYSSPRQAQMMIDSREHTMAEIAETFHVGRATLYRQLNAYKDGGDCALVVYRNTHTRKVDADTNRRYGETGASEKSSSTSTASGSRSRRPAGPGSRPRSPTSSTPARGVRRRARVRPRSAACRAGYGLRRRTGLRRPWRATAMPGSALVLSATTRSWTR
jgi:hypothetical protein